MMDFTSMMMPAKVRASMSYDPMTDTYNVTLSWYFGNQKQGTAKHVTGYIANIEFGYVILGMVDEAVKYMGALWEEHQEEVFRAKAASVLDEIGKAIKNNKTNASVTADDGVQWATGNKTAKIKQVGKSVPKYSHTLPKYKNVGNNVANIALTKLPGMQTWVKYPCDHGGKEKARVYDLVQHLNDTDEWSREKIADWIDELHDKGIINAEFQPWGEEDSPEPEEHGTIELEAYIPPTTNLFLDKEGKIYELTKEETADLYQKYATVGEWQNVGFTSDSWLSLGPFSIAEEQNPKEENNGDHDQDKD